MRVENDEMYGDWAHWLQAPCPSCQSQIRVHHLHEFAGAACPSCRQNPILKFAGVEQDSDPPAALTRLLLADGLLSEVAADVARELKAGEPLPRFLEFLIGLHYVKPESLEACVRKHAPAAWLEGMTMTFDPQVAARAATPVLHDGDRCNLAEWEISPELIKKVPRTIARVYRCLPVTEDGGVLILAVEDPERVRRGDLEGLLGCEIRLVKSPREQISQGLAKHYGSAGWQEALW